MIQMIDVGPQCSLQNVPINLITLYNTHPFSNSSLHFLTTSKRRTHIQTSDPIVKRSNLEIIIHNDTRHEDFQKYVLFCMFLDDLLKHQKTFFFATYRFPTRHEKRPGSTPFWKTRSFP